MVLIMEACLMSLVSRRSWRKSVCVLWWRGQSILWAVVVAGVGINLASSWLTAKQWDISGTPLGWLLAHPVVLVVGCTVLIIQALGSFWTVRRGRSSNPSSASLHLEQREQTILRACGDIEQTLPGPQLPSVATVLHALKDRYAVQDIVDTLEWLEQQGNIQLARAFADPELHHHYAEAWSFYLTP